MITRHCWCGATEARPVARVPIGDTVLPWCRCTGCGVYTYIPAPSPTVVRAAYAAEYYGRDRRKFVGPVAAAVGWFQQGRARLVARHLGRGSARLLDIGAGNGGFAHQMLALGHRVEATEWTAESAARIPPAPGLAVHVGDLAELQLPQGAYDAITLWHVFEHLADPDSTMARLYSLLRPGGWLFLAMPNHESPQARRHGRHWFHLDPPRHLFGWGPRSLEVLLRRHGLRRKSLSTWSLEQNPYGEVQSLLNAAGFRRDAAYEALKGTSRAGIAERAGHMALAAVLAPWGLASSTIESAMGRGATFTMVARKGRG